MEEQSSAGRKKGRWEPGMSGNPTGRATAPLVPLPTVEELDQLAKQPREKQGELLRIQAFRMSLYEGESLLSDMIRPGKKDWNQLRNRKISWGISVDKVLNSLDNAEEIRIKLPAQLQEGVRLMMQVAIQRQTQTGTTPIEESHREEE